MKNNSSSPAIILKKYRYDQELMRDCERVPYVIRGGKYEWSVDIRSVTIADYLITFPCWGEMLLDQNIKGGRNLNYIYIVECKDGTYYTGWTNNLEKRIKDHNNGKGAKYTKSRIPVSLVYYEEFQTKEEAMRREYAIKRMKRNEKCSLVLSKENIRTMKKMKQCNEDL